MFIFNHPIINLLCSVIDLQEKCNEVVLDVILKNMS